MKEAIAGAWEQLEFCRHGLTFFERLDESSRKLGANIIIQSGRAVTYGFEDLAKRSVQFDSWYRPYKAELRANPVFNYFREVRNVLVHRSGRIDLHHISTIPIHDPKPGAIEELIVDGSTIDHMSIDFVHNRRYLVVTTPDGRIEERDVPQKREGHWWELVDIQSYFRDAPPEFAGITVVQCCQQYVLFLEKMVRDADARF